MPELPEVETVCRGLKALTVGKTIESARVTLPRIVRRPNDVHLFEALLEGRTVESTRRRGKYLLIHMSGDWTLVSHLRMEGRYGLYAANDEVEPHTHVTFRFTDGTELRYRDVRQFGTMDLVPSERVAELPGLRDLGPEPLSDDFTPETLRERMEHRSTRVKPALLDQTMIAGLGNIYVDEILYRAGIHPMRACSDLSDDEQGRLYESIRDVLATAVELGGSSIKSYVNGYGEVGSYQFALQVYGRQGEACGRCGTPIEKSRVGGRGTHVCPRCQRFIAAR